MNTEIDFEFIVDCGFLYDEIQNSLFVNLICICFVDLSNRIATRVFSPRDNNDHYDYLYKALLNEEIPNPFLPNKRMPAKYFHYICFTSKKGMFFKRVKK